MTFLSVFLAGISAGGASPSPTATPTIFVPAPLHFWWLLSGTIWAPVGMAVLMAFMPEPRARRMRLFYGFAFWTNMAVLGLALFAYNQASIFTPGNQFEETWNWLPAFGVSYHLAADGISIPLLMSASFIAVVATLASGEVRDRPREFFILLLLAEAAVNGVIAAQDMFMLALFWGAAAIPLALLVWGWGGPLRQRVAARVIALGAFGTVLLIVVAFLLFAFSGGISFNFDYIFKATLTPRLQLVVSVLLVVAAATRLPLVPFHGWLRDLLAEAPPGVAMYAAGALAPTGGYVLIRVLVANEPAGAGLVAPLVGGLAALTVIYAAVAAFGSLDVRRFGAYAALVPGAVLALGIAGLTPMSILGASFQLVAGGIAAALAVGVCGVIAARAQTRDATLLGGLGPRMPRLAWLLVLAGLAVIGLPGFASFLAEFFTFLGSFYKQPGASFLVGFGLALSAAAFAFWIQRALFGRPNPDAPGASDAGLTEVWYLGLLVAALLWFGILPGGPKLGGTVSLFDQGIVNVIVNQSADISGPYAPPER